LSSTADVTTDFFQALAGGGPRPELENTKGTLRFDLSDTRQRTARWLVALESGTVTVSRRNAKADCIVRMDKALFERLASGEENAMAAMLRGAIEVKGDPALLLPFQRLLPAPPRSTR
jgi:putative sterol carrier protein